MCPTQGCYSAMVEYFQTYIYTTGALAIVVLSIEVCAFSINWLVIDLIWLIFLMWGIESRTQTSKNLWLRWGGGGDRSAGLMEPPLIG